MFMKINKMKMNFNLRPLHLFVGINEENIVLNLIKGNTNTKKSGQQCKLFRSTQDL